MSSFETRRTAIMSEAAAAMAENDYLTVARIYARLSPQSLDEVISEAVARAIRNASDIELSLAAQFAERSAELREATEARLA